MEPQFVMFSSQHGYAVLGNALFGVLLIFAGMMLKKTTYEWIPRWFLIVSLWFIWVYLRIWRIQHGMFTVQENLPIHLCGFSSLLVPLMLMNRSHKLYQVMYYWGMGGATQSLATPTVERGFPHFLYFEFFFTHAMIIAGVLYATFVWKYRPNFNGLIRSWVIAAALLVPIGLINMLLHSNYFFIAHKPETASLLDFLGPWPWYLVSLSFVAFGIFLVFWLPFPIYRWLKTRLTAKS